MNNKLTFSVNRPLVVELDVMPRSLNPLEVHDFASEQVVALIVDTLFTIDPGSREAKPALAASAVRRGCIWSIQLRRDICFSDSSPIQARHFAQALNGLARVGGPLDWIGQLFKGFQEVRNALADTVSGVRTPNNHTLELETVRPIGYLPELLSSPIFAPIHDDPSVVSGPYRVGGFYPNERGVILLRNEKARRGTPRSPQCVAFLRTDNPRQGLTLFRQGRLHISATTSFPIDEIGRLGDLIDLQSDRINLFSQLIPNASRVPELRCRHLRRALSLSIDRAAISGSVAGTLSPMLGYIDPWKCEDEAASLPVEEALRSLQRSVAVPARLEVCFADFAPNDIVVGALAEQIEQILGIGINLRSLSYDELFERQFSGGFDLLYTITSAPWHDPASVLNAFREHGPMAQWTGFHSKEYEALLDLAEEPKSLSKRLPLYIKAHEKLEESMPTIPLLRLNSLFARSDKIAPLAVLASGAILLEDLLEAGT